MAIAVTAVGVLLLTAHYFVRYLLLAALPSKQWREAAMSPDRLLRHRNGVTHGLRVGLVCGEVERPVGPNSLLVALANRPRQ